MPRTARLAALLLLSWTTPGLARGAAGARPPEERRASAKAIAAYVRAQRARTEGDARAAIEALRIALAHDPESAQLRISYAEALAQGGRLASAEAEARRAVQIASGSAAGADAQRVLGKVLLLRGQAEPAEKVLLRATTLEAERVRATRERPPDDPEGARLDPEPWRLLAEARLRQGDTTGAVAAGEELATLSADEGAAVLRAVASRLLDAHDAASAEPIAQRATVLAHADAASWKLLSRAQEGRGNLDGARRSIEQALAADPEDPEALLAAGKLSVHRGDLPTARAWFQQLLRIAPDERAAQLRVASSWLDSKRPVEALEVVAAADGPEALYLRAVALTRLRRWADAVAVLDRIGSAPDELGSAACALRGNALARLERTPEALRVLRDGLARWPRDPVLLFALGEVHDRAGDRAAALAQMRAVLRVSPDHAEAMNYLGYAYAEGDERLDEAEALLRRALRAEPDNAYFLDSLGWILYKRRDLGRAVEALERAATLAPELTILDHLGDAYRAAQRPTEAAGAYQRALLSGDPEDEEPGISSAERRTLVRQKLDTLGAPDERAANLRH